MSDLLRDIFDGHCLGKIRGSTTITATQVLIKALAQGFPDIFCWESFVCTVDPTQASGRVHDRFSHRILNRALNFYESLSVGGIGADGNNFCSNKRQSFLYCATIIPRASHYAI